ncbi:CD209 antigen-like protein E [Sphaeramia orbicularis]|uniref:CD209 antigen-like protein E n=1 Tax=Sphaeramia orbicularis TaxID=375764 RepID=UPI00118163A6|nr:CD209 antigen-like protein E [Sphaeramia orbicularis]
MSRRSHREGKARAGSKVTKERVGLVVLGALLAASLIVIYRVSFENFWTNRRLQTLKEETEALKRNCSDKPSPVCDEAWERHGEKCYYFSTFKSSWDIGRRFCKEFGADLVKIDSEEEQRFLLNKVKDIMTEEEDKFWIGLTDSKTEGKWVWVDNSSLDDKLQFWWNDSKPIEPDNWPGEDPDGEDCVRMGELGPVTKLNRWLDKSCKVAQRSICEKPAKRRQ